MTLEDLGYNIKLEEYRIENGLDSLEVGRVILEHRERYVLRSEKHEYEAELMGNMRFSADSRYDLPAVGDWVAFMEYDEGKALIHALYPRKSIIERKAVGKSGHVQIIACNIDFALILQAVDRDFNLNRLERYLTICYNADVKAIMVLSKVDLISESQLLAITDQIRQRHQDLTILHVSNETIGYEQVAAVIESGKSYCLLGSSGVGKSTLLNGLSGKEEMKTGEISTAVNKGKHVTSHRELFVLENGGILIDNPGMREVGLTESSHGLELTFDTILAYAPNCRFKDCTHIHEAGCAVLEAVDNGEIDEQAYANFLKMEKEKQHFESDAQDKRKKDKNLGKIIREVKKHNRKYN